MCMPLLYTPRAFYKPSDASASIKLLATCVWTIVGRLHDSVYCGSLAANKWIMFNWLLRCLSIVWVKTCWCTQHLCLSLAEELMVWSRCSPIVLSPGCQAWLIEYYISWRILTSPDQVSSTSKFRSKQDETGGAIF